MHQWQLSQSYSTPGTKLCFLDMMKLAWGAWTEDALANQSYPHEPGYKRDAEKVGKAAGEVKG